MDDIGTDATDVGQASGPAGRPANFVAGVMHDKAKFDNAVDEIVALGIDRSSIGILYGQEGAEAIEQRHRHWFTDLLSDEQTYVERYEDEIRQGGFVIGVPLDKHHDHDREKVRQILRANGAHYVVSRTPLTYTIDD